MHRHDERERRPSEPPRAPRVRPAAPAAAAVLDLQRSAGNQAVARMLAREYTPSTEETTEFTGKRGWTEETLGELSRWAKSREQFLAVAKELSYARWGDLTPLFRDGTDAPATVREMQIAYQRGHIGTRVFPEGTTTYRGLKGTTWDVSTSKRDWSGLYLAFGIEHAEGYLTDGLDKQGSGTASIWECTLTKPLKVRSVGGNFIPDSKIDENEKAEILKGAMDIDPSQKLVGTIGGTDHAYLGIDQGSSQELVMPWELAAGYLSNKRIREYRYVGWDLKETKIL